MRIACSSCNAVYELPPERVKPGRGVKCARCGTVWVPVELVDAEPEIRPEAPAPPEPPPPDPQASKPLPSEPKALQPVPSDGPSPETPPAPVVEPRRRDRTLLVAWILSVVVLVALGWAAVQYRGAVTQAWPPAERAYRLLHLGGNSLAP